MSIMSFLGTLGLDFGQNLLNYGLFDTAQQRQERLGREAMDVAGQSYERTTDPRSYLAGGMPSISMNGYKYGDPNGGAIDFNQLFGSTPDYQGTYEKDYGSMAPDWAASDKAGTAALSNRLDTGKLTGDIKSLFEGGPDFSQSRSNIRDILGKWQRSSADAANETAGYFPTDTSFRQSLSSELGAIGSSARSKAELDRGQMISSALAGGKSLQDIQGNLDRYNFDAGSARALQAQTAKAGNEKLQTDAAINRANAMNSSAMTQANINAALAQSGASAETTLSGQESAANTARGNAAADIYGKGLDINAQQDRSLADYIRQFATDRASAANSFATGVNRAQEAGSSEQMTRSGSMLDRLQQMIFGPALAANSSAIGNQMSTDQMMAQILAGVPVGTYQTNFGNSQSWLASTAAANASKPERQSPFSFGISI